MMDLPISLCNGAYKVISKVLAIEIHSEILSECSWVMIVSSVYGSASFSRFE